jgi:hypothetical protein
MAVGRNVVRTVGILAVVAACKDAPAALRSRSG